jgi:hypothetical protein
MKSAFSRGVVLTLATVLGGVVAQFGVASADDSATTKPTTVPAVIPWADAAKHVGETVSITGPVISTHKSAAGKTVSLNIGKDYPDPGRFTIFVSTDKPDDADAAYKGKSVTVIGKVLLYKKVAEIKASEKDLKLEP